MRTRTPARKGLEKRTSGAVYVVWVGGVVGLKWTFERDDGLADCRRDKSDKNDMYAGAS